MRGTEPHNGKSCIAFVNDDDGGPTDIIANGVCRPWVGRIKKNKIKKIKKRSPSERDCHLYYFNVLPSPPTHNAFVVVLANIARPNNGIENMLKKKKSTASP